MGRTIAERLSEAAERSFVGRDAELELLNQAIAADEPPFLVAYIHGPGGIGTSRLLQAAVRGAGSDIRTIALDCARGEPTPRGFLSALGETNATATGAPTTSARRRGGVQFTTRHTMNAIAASAHTAITTPSHCWRKTTTAPQITVRRIQPYSLHTLLRP